MFFIPATERIQASGRELRRWLVPVREPGLRADLMIVSFGSTVTATDDSCIPKFYILSGAHLLSLSVESGEKQAGSLGSAGQEHSLGTFSSGCSPVWRLISQLLSWGHEVRHCCLSSSYSCAQQLNIFSYCRVLIFAGFKGGAMF